MVLGAALPLELRESRFAVYDHIWGTEEVFFNSDYLADGAIMDSLDGFGVAGVISAVQAGNNAQSLLLCQVGGLLHKLDPGWVDAVRLLHKNVLSGLNRGHRMERVELGSVGN